MGSNAGLSVGTTINGSPGGAVTHQIPAVPVAFVDHQVYLSVYEFVVPGTNPPVQVTGNGTTDDSAAIQAAINACAASGRSLYFPSGVFSVVANALTNASGVPILFGPGASATGANAASLTSQWSPATGPASVSINVAAGGTFTLTAAQAAAETIVLTGSLAGSVTVVFPPYVGHVWNIDATGCTLNANTITARANGNNWATTIGVTNLYQVTYGGTAGKLYGTAITP